MLVMLLLFPNLLLDMNLKFFLELQVALRHTRIDEKVNVPIQHFQMASLK